jgi:hypothetical protein
VRHGRLGPRRRLVVTAAALNADEAGVSLHWNVVLVPA